VSDDEPVVVSPDRPLRLSAEAMRALRKATGCSMTELLADDDDEANRLQVVAFAELHRRAKRSGHEPDAATLWDQAGQIEVDFAAPERLDPLDDGSSTTSPPSAVTGA